MKNTLKILSVFMLGMILFTSCSKKDDPADNDFFIGTYNGEISYKKTGNEIIIDEDGKVTVSKFGDTYKFIFGSKIPDISGVKFEKSGDNTYVSVGSGLTGITITASKLKMLVIKGDETWTADCTR